MAAKDLRDLFEICEYVLADLTGLKQSRRSPLAVDSQIWNMRGHSKICENVLADMMSPFGFARLVSQHEVAVGSDNDLRVMFCDDVLVDPTHTSVLLVLSRNTM